MLPKHRFNANFYHFSLNFVTKFAIFRDLPREPPFANQANKACCRASHFAQFGKNTNGESVRFITLGTYFLPVQRHRLMVALRCGGPCAMSSRARKIGVHGGYSELGPFATVAF